MAARPNTPPKPKYKPNQLVKGGVRKRAVKRAGKLNVMPQIKKGGVTGHEARLVRKRWLERRDGTPGSRPQPQAPEVPQPQAQSPAVQALYNADYAGGSQASADTYSSALDLIRNSTMTGLTSSQNALDQGMQSLGRRFFDTTNEFSEASTLATAQKRAEQVSFLEAAKSGQAHAGSYLQDQQSMAERARGQRAEMQSDYDQLVQGLVGERQARDQELYDNLAGAEYDDAVRIADDEDLTTMLQEYGLKPQAQAPAAAPAAPAKPAPGKPGPRFKASELVKAGVRKRAIKRAKYVGGQANVEQIKKGGITGAEARRVKHKAAAKRKQKGK